MLKSVFWDSFEAYCNKFEYSIDSLMATFLDPRSKRFARFDPHKSKAMILQAKDAIRELYKNLLESEVQQASQFEQESEDDGDDLEDASTPNVIGKPLANLFDVDEHVNENEIENASSNHALTKEFRENIALYVSWMTQNVLKSL